VCPKGEGGFTVPEILLPVSGSFQGEPAGLLGFLSPRLQQLCLLFLKHEGTVFGSGVDRSD
jgi:hypothetical protein